MTDKTGIMIATALGGGILLWSGISNKGVLTTTRDLLQGNKPPAGPAQSFGINLGAAGSSAGGTSTAPAVSGSYSHAKLEQLWISQGGAGATANMAAAIAQAESGGRPNASNKNTDGSEDRGLWQINSVHGSLSTFDPAANARAAITISSNGLNWSPWVTFKTGAYRKYLGAN